MIIEISIMIEEEIVRTLTYESTNVPIPNVGESVVNPRTDGLVVKVQRRIFDYGEKRVLVTLDCS